MQDDILASSRVVDLFCGIGGLSYGLLQEGFNLSAGIDFDASCRFAYEANHGVPFLHKDLTITHSHDIAELFQEAPFRVLVGCAPCQAFSNYTNKHKNNDKWKLLYSFSRFIYELQPEIVSMENVPQLLGYMEGKVFEDFMAVLKEVGYHVDYKIVNAADYGVPQSRKRLILLASKFGPIPLISPTHQTKEHLTVRNAIGHLPPIVDGEVHHSDPMHCSPKLNDLNKRRMLATPAGGGWQDWNEELLLECHKKETGKSFKSVYGRMWWDKSAPTITTQATGIGNGRFGHPDQNRAISLREAAILQSFPDDFKFSPEGRPITPTIIKRHIGNAVPVALGRAIGKSIKIHLHGIKHKKVCGK